MRRRIGKDLRSVSICCVVKSFINEIFKNCKRSEVLWLYESGMWRMVMMCLSLR